MNAPQALFKTVHFVGDSHALAFKGKAIHNAEQNLVATASVCYVRGLTALNLIDGQQVHPEIATYFLQQKIASKEARSVALTDDTAAIAEQYATGRGFERHLVVFFSGEIYVRKFLGSLHAGAKLDLDAIKARFGEVARKYIADVRTIVEAFDFRALVHLLNPPTGDDKIFEKINNFHCPLEVRATMYRLYNEALQEAANAKAVPCLGMTNLIAENGCLRPEYEFDGVHADPKYAEHLIAAVIDSWLMGRGGEQSPRYHRWSQRLGTQAPPLIATQQVTSAGVCFDAPQVAALRASLGTFDVAVCKSPMLDWAHFPVRKGARKYNEVVKYAPVTPPGLKILHDVLIAGETGAKIRALLGGNFSLVNCRAVESLPHQNDGIGQQFFHRDGCPPAVYRGLIYLVDVDDVSSGPFEFLAGPKADQPIQATGKAGSLLIFDANAVAHRAAPPRTATRYAIDLIILLHPPEIQPIVHSHALCAWPVDPYLFNFPGATYPAAKGGRWFHPALIMPPKTTTKVKTLSDAEMAVGAGT